MGHMITMLASVLFILIMSSCLAWTPSSHFPSCFSAGLTPDQSTVLSVTVNTPTPELCQDICANTTACSSFTWLSEDSPLLPMSCALYTGNYADNSCAHCVSGSPVCSCTVPGLCDEEQN